MDGNQPVSPVTLQMLNSLIDTQTRLRDAAEARWAAAREALFNLARLVAADWLEEKQKEKGGLEVLRIEELSQVVYQRISELCSTAILPDVKQLQKAAERIEALSRKIDDLAFQGEQNENTKQELLSEIEQLQTENKRLLAKSEKVQRNPQPEEIGLKSIPIPPWFPKWAASTGFERQSFVIRLMGDTGLARRTKIVDALIDKFEVDKKYGSVSNLFSRMCELGFVVKEGTDGTGKGAPPDVLYLDSLGQDAYLFMTQKLPADNEYFSIRPAHSTDAHALLVLKASDFLTEEGYEIISNGEINIPLPDGRISSPDILARKDGREIRVEVERDVSKGDSDGRERKWQNAFDAGQGCLYVFCETEKLQKKLVQEINRALASESRLERANTFMTNLEALKAGERHADGSIWASQKHSSSVRKPRE